MDLKLEAIIIPVSDVDRAKKFYEKSLGFRVNVDHRSTDNPPAIRPVISENCSRGKTVEKCELAQLLH